jgi:hypothetical protein
MWEGILVGAGLMNQVRQIAQGLCGTLAVGLNCASGWNRSGWYCCGKSR